MNEVCELYVRHLWRLLHGAVWCMSLNCQDTWGDMDHLPIALRRVQPQRFHTPSSLVLISPVLRLPRHCFLFLAALVLRDRATVDNSRADLRVYLLPSPVSFVNGDVRRHPMHIRTPEQELSRGAACATDYCCLFSSSFLAVMKGRSPFFRGRILVFGAFRPKLLPSLRFAGFCQVCRAQSTLERLHAA